MNCLNCAQPISGKFCPNCGQKSSVTRLTSHTIFHDLQHSLIHLDKGVWVNLKTLWQPERILEYIEGKRVRFFNPVAYLLILTGILVLTITLVYKPDTAAIATPEVDKNAMYQIGHSLYKIYAHFGKFMIALLPMPMAIHTVWIYKKSQYNFWEHVYIFIFITANLTLVSILAIPLWAKFPMPFSIGWVYCFYLGFCVYSVFKRKNPGVSGILRVVLSLFIGFITVAALLLMVGWIVASFSNE